MGGEEKGRDLSTCGKILRVIFVIINGLATLMGIGTLAVGIYSLVTNRKYEFITGNDHVAPATLLIIVGTVITLVALAGIVGAVLRKRLLLIIYIAVWVVVIILEIVAVALGFAYSENVTENVEKRYRDGWENAINEYTTDKAAKDAVDTIQKNVIEILVNGIYHCFCLQGKCCGLNNATDWVELNSTYFNEYLSLPESCKCESGSEYCTNFTLEFDDQEYPQTDHYERGCYDSTVDLFQYVQQVSAIVGVVFAVIELIAVLLAAGVLYYICKAEKKYESV